jgi:hypothetical protein
MATAATLRADAAVVAPELPNRDWHELTLQWWRDVWASPMAPEFDTSDRHGLFLLAAIVDDFWSAGSATERTRLAAEVRQQGMRFGLSPIDRRRLQWEIERSDEAKAKGDVRRARPSSSSSRSQVDPREVLRAL